MIEQIADVCVNITTIGDHAEPMKHRQYHKDQLEHEINLLTLKEDKK